MSYNKHQHRCKAKNNTLSKFLCRKNKLIDNFGKGYNVDVIYFDFTKAFDTVDHGIVNEKLCNLGIKGKFWKYIESFLFNQKKFIAINGALSSKILALSSVLKSTILTPLLFLMFIQNSLYFTITYNFANDKKRFFFQISKINLILWTTKMT